MRHRLPQLAARTRELEMCVYCPKLCRTACPVSNAEPNETLTPWGKMRAAFFATRSEQVVTESDDHAVWACTGCGDCTLQCQHRNDVASVLLSARAETHKAGGLPRPVSRMLERWNARHAGPVEIPKVPTLLVAGCMHRNDVRTDVMHAAESLCPNPVAHLPICCGAPLLYGGDADGFERHVHRHASALRHARQIVCADAGCAAVMRRDWPRVGVRLAPRVVHLAEVALEHRSQLRVVPDGAENIRWHEPCQLRRGLDDGDAPRRVLADIFGRSPAEVQTFGDDSGRGRCSGAGGLLPLTMPRIAAQIARERIEEHKRQGGEMIVTSCAASKRALEAALRRDGHHHVGTVLDFATLLSRSLRGEHAK